MQTIECYHVTHSVFWYTAREASFTFLSLFRIVMELNHYNKYLTRSVLKLVKANFSFHFWNMKKRSDQSIQWVSLYLQYRFFSVSWIFWGQNWVSIKPDWPCCSYSSVSLLAHRLWSWQCWTHHRLRLVLCLLCFIKQILEYGCNYSTE